MLRQQPQHLDGQGKRLVIAVQAREALLGEQAREALLGGQRVGRRGRRIRYIRRRW